MKSIGQILGVMTNKIPQEINGNHSRAVTGFIRIETIYLNFSLTQIERHRATLPKFVTALRPF